MKKRSRDTKSLFLSTRQICRLLIEHCIQSVLRLEKLIQINFFKYRKKLFLCCRWISHQQIFSNTPLKQIILERYKRHLFHALLYRDHPNILATDQHLSTLRSLIPHKQ